MLFINIGISALTIGICTWIAEKKPELAGFLMSMPLSTLLILFLTQNQYGDDQKSILLAKSISIAIPATLIFFVPFLLSKPLKLSFWTCYFSGMGLLVVSYFLHKGILSYFKI